MFQNSVIFYGTEANATCKHSSALYSSYFGVKRAGTKQTRCGCQSQYGFKTLKSTKEHKCKFSWKVECSKDDKKTFGRTASS